MSLRVPSKTRANSAQILKLQQVGLGGGVLFYCMYLFPHTFRWASSIVVVKNSHVRTVEATLNLSLALEGLIWVFCLRFSVFILYVLHLFKVISQAFVMCVRTYVISCLSYFNSCFNECKIYTVLQFECHFLLKILDISDNSFRLI